MELELTAQTLTAADGNQQAFGFPEPLEILVRADSVDVLSMIAIPAEQTEISGTFCTPSSTAFSCRHNERITHT